VNKQLALTENSTDTISKRNSIDQTPTDHAAHNKGNLVIAVPSS